MDIVIPVGTESRWHDNELRFTLRSIEQNLTGYRNVIIVGWCPPWVQNVVHIKKEDRAGKKQFSIFSKTMAAFDHEETSDSILFWNDDHFLMGGLDVKDFRYWYDGTIDEWGQKAIGNYKGAIRNTAEIKGLNRFYTDIHTPIIYQRAKFKALAELDWSKEYVIKTAYTMQEVGNFEFLADLKVNKAMPYEQFKGKIEGRKWLSIGPYGVCPGLVQLLSEYFPKRSKYENSNHLSKH
jgi:hypothetical protein